jgi:hypothetical protein
MKKKIKYIIISLVIAFISPSNLHSQSDSAFPDTTLTYYPLSIGDKWVFDEYATSTIPPIITIHRVWSLEVIKDTLMPNNEDYFLVQQINYGGTPTIGMSYERIDSAELKVYRYDSDFDTTNYEILILDLSVELFGTFYTPYCEVIFAEYGSTVRFGQTFNYRGYYETCGFFYPDYFFLKGIGLYRYNWYADFVQSSSTLRGCLVNGILYGDTTVVSVTEQEPNPNLFFLEQNYPNPFNPTTKIKFTIPSVIANPDEIGMKQSQLITLKVYDVLGNEVVTLVNEEKPAGSYEVEFSAKGGSASGGNAFNLPSGVYFYQLETGSFVETKKMILLK